MVLFASLPISMVLLVPLVLGLGFLLALILLGKVPLGYNLRSLTVRWLTTLSIALAFTVVVALLMVMGAFVNGMYYLTENSGQAANVMVISDGAPDELFSNLMHSDTSNVERERVMSGEKVAAEVKQVEIGGKKQFLASREIYLVINQPLPQVPGEAARRRFLQVRGLDDTRLAAMVHKMELYPGGQWLEDLDGRRQEELPEDQGTAIRAYLGEGVAQVLAQDRNKPRLDIGDVFELGDRLWIVKGIMKSAGSTFDSEIWAHQQVVGPMFRKETYTTIVLRAQDGQGNESSESAQILSDHLSKNFKPAVLAQPETEYYAKLNQTNLQFLVAIGFIAVVLAMGGVFGVMTTMFAAISQRKADIAVLRILGFARWQILVSFLLESLLIALVGGLLGCALGYLANGWQANSIVSSGQGGGKSIVLKLVVDANLLGMGLLFTLVCGLLGGFFPAVTAMRLRPLESLR